MSGQSRTGRTRALALGGLLAALLVTPGTVAGHSPATPAAAAQRLSADIAPVLGADGTFQGAVGVAGTVDASAWTMVSDLAAGEPPRFARAAGAAPAVTLADAGIWSALGSNGDDGAVNDDIYALAVSGADLYVGGTFTNAAGNAAADYVARWNGSTWSALGSNGVDGAIYGYVFALAVWGSDVYVGGGFSNVAGIPEADYIAMWNGSAWSALGSNGVGYGAISGTIYALAISNSGSDLYVGGSFANAGGLQAADHIAKWNGVTWSALAPVGATDGVLTSSVRAIAVSGTDVFAGGLFLNAADIPAADFIARWDGRAWSALGASGGDGALNDFVHALAVVGHDIYAGGDFSNAAGLPGADYIAMWDGSAWSALGSNGGDGALTNRVYALTASGSDLYVGGAFGNAAGATEADYLARWNGSTWSALGSDGFANGAIQGYVRAVAISGVNRYVGGDFTDAGGIAAADFVAKWSPGSAVVRKPDGRIRLGTSGAYLGNDVYNTTGTGQTKTGSAKKGRTITFGISVQNDGTAADSFKIKATGSAASAYTVKYYAGTKDITAKVVAGTYRTASLAKGAATLITVKVTIRTSAKAGSRVTRLVTITSVASSSKKDVVKFVAKRS